MSWKLQSQAFTSSNNFAVPANVTCVWVTLVAAGGGGGSGMAGAFSYGLGGGGGGGGQTFYKIPITVSPGNIVVTIGAGGQGGNGILYLFEGPTHGNAGNNGGNSNFGSYLIAVGGAGGKEADNSRGAGNGGAGGGVQGGLGGNNGGWWDGANGSPGGNGNLYVMRGIAGAGGGGGGPEVYADPFYIARSGGNGGIDGKYNGGVGGPGGNKDRKSVV